MRKLLLSAALLCSACTALGLTSPNLTTDCDAQAALLARATRDIAEVRVAERAAIDADIAVSKGYCSGTLPADQTAASKAVEAANAHIAAILAVVELR